MRINFKRNILNINVCKEVDFGGETFLIMRYYNRLSWQIISSNNYSIPQSNFQIRVSIQLKRTCITNWDESSPFLIFLSFFSPLPHFWFTYYHGLFFYWNNTIIWWNYLDIGYKVIQWFYSVFFLLAFCVCKLNKKTLKIWKIE